MGFAPYDRGGLGLYTSTLSIFPTLRAGRGLAPQLHDQGYNSLSYQDGDDAVYRPGEVPAEEKHVKKRRHVRAQEDRAPQHNFFGKFFSQRPEHAEQRIVEKWHANQVDDHEDDRVDAVGVTRRPYQFFDPGYYII